MEKSTILKNFLLLFLILGLSITLYGCQKEESDSRWIKVMQSQNTYSKYVLYYDKQSIDTPALNIIRVLIKQKYLDRSLANYSLFLMEFNYKEKTWHFLDVIKYDKNDRILSPDIISTLQKSPGWHPINSCSDCQSLFMEIGKREFGGLLKKIHS